MKHRPVGVLVCAVLLVLAGLFQLFFAAVSLICSVAVPRVPITVQPGVAPPSPAFLLAVMIFSSLFYLALAAWAGTTAVGLFRMRTWARVSAMVIGAGLIVVGLFGAVGMFAMQFVVSSTPLPPTVNPGSLRFVFHIAAVFSLALAAIGVWWVVYFSLRRTRTAFLLLPRTQDETGPQEVVGASTDPRLGAHSRESHESYASSARARLVGSAQTSRPVSVSVIAILMLIASFSALLQMFSPLPLFLFGVTLSGWPAHISMLMWCAVNGVSGFGLLRLEKPAWVLALGIFCFPVLNACVMLLPTSRDHLATYMHTVMQRSSFGLPQPQLPPPFMTVVLCLGALVALLASGAILTLLWRARWAFTNGDERQAAR